MHKKSSSTREIILKILKVQKRLTVSEMAEQLAITEMAVRRHLNSLQHEGLIESTIVRQAMGRPLHIYTLTDEGDEHFPRKYKSLILELMKDIEEINGSEMIDHLLEKRQERLRKSFLERLKNKSFKEKVEELATIQNENGYMVELERKQDGSFHLIEYNCPISQVADNYEKACNCELELFREVLETEEINRNSCLASGGDFCDYQIKKTNTN